MLQTGSLVGTLLAEQREQIDHFFEKIDHDKAQEIVELLYKCKGTIFFSGIGKSGIIADKVVKTLISTGTKALYLPPMNALHGDIGILTPDDLFVCLSKSGDTQELLDILPHVKDRGVKTIAWVCRPMSRLEKNCDHTILLPIQRELCPFDLAPTTSTAVQLLFGDILAVALMRKKEFTLEDFAQNHPAGNIGKKLTYKVDEFMLQGEQLPLCKRDDTLSQSLIELSNKRCGCVLIVDESMHFEGIFTDGDLRRTLQQKKDNLLDLPMHMLMNTQSLTTEKNALLINALQLMQSHTGKWVKELPVLSNDKVIGLIRMHDIVQIGIS